jgi:hypothetical protein
MAPSRILPKSRRACINLPSFPLEFALKRLAAISLYRIALPNWGKVFRAAIRTAPASVKRSSPNSG